MKFRLKNQIKKILGYKFPYRIAYSRFLLQKLFNSFFSGALNQYDLVFVSGEPGWILDGICKEIDKYYPGKTAFYYTISDLPPAKAYFFSHYSLFTRAITKNPHLLGAKNLVWYTHPRHIGKSNNELVYALNHSTKVLATNSANEASLRSMGLKAEKVQTLLGGADEKIFTPRSPRVGDRRCVGFCLIFRDSEHVRERKNYDLIIHLIKSIKDADTMIIGRGWEQYERFDEIRCLPNFSYVEVPYEEYPKYYHKMDVFVSASRLEGGPIPLIEAMMCNVFPVVSNTGFAAEIINHGKNGFLFDVDSPKETICELIEKALKMKTDVRKTVEHLTWENFSLEVQRYIE